MKNLGKLIILGLASFALAGCSLDGLAFGNSSEDLFGGNGGGLFENTSADNPFATTSSSSTGRTSSSQSSSKEVPVYVFNFWNWDGSFLWSTSAQYGDKVVYEGPTPTRPSETGWDYEFAYWENDYLLDRATRDADLFAVFNSKQWEVHATFLDQFGEVLWETDVGYGNSPWYGGPTPTKESDSVEYCYKFGQWEPYLWEPIYEDTVYTPVFYEERNPDPTPYTQGLDFSYAEDRGGYFVSGYWGSSTEIEIPARFDWKPVIGIFDWALDNKNLTKVILPDTLKYIYNYALSNNPNLTSIDLPDSLVAIGAEAFVGTPAMKSTKEDGYVYLGTADNPYLVLTRVTDQALSAYTIRDEVRILGDGAFRFCYNLESIVIPDAVRSVGDHCFSDCNALKNVTLGSNLLYIGEWAFIGCYNLSLVENVPDGVEAILTGTFEGCTLLTSFDLPENLERIETDAFANTGLTSLFIPASVRYIRSSAFRDCNSLETLEVSADNPYLSIRDGYLLDKEGKTLNAVLLPLGEEGVLAIPESVTEIAANAFFNIQEIKSVKWNEGIERIGAGAFSLCQSLVVDEIPATVTYLGDGAFSNCSSIVEMEIKTGADLLSCTFSDCPALTTVRFSSGTKKIGFRAFANCSKLADLSLPASLERIESDAFTGCSSLTEVTLPSGFAFMDNNPFAGCTSLSKINVADGNMNFCSENGVLFNADKTRVILSPAANDLGAYILPSTVKEIADQAFAFNANLTSIVIPAQLNWVGWHAFSECDNLVKADLSAVKTFDSFNSELFQGCDSLSEVVVSTIIERLPWGFLRNCPSITSFEFPQLLKTIEGSAFYGTGFTSLELPASLTWIGSCAFGNCDALTEVTIPEGADLQESDTFADCDNLETVHLPAGIETIPGNCFGCCYKLTTITGGEKVRQICSSAFNSCRALKDLSAFPVVETIDSCAFADCDALTEVELPETLTYLGESAFYGTDNLVSVSLPDSLTALERYTFAYCYALNSVRFGSALKSIAPYAFIECESLKEVVLPVTLTSIGEYALNRVETIYFEGTTAHWMVISFGINAIGSATVYCYSESDPSPDTGYWHYVDGVPTPWVVAA